MLTIKSPINSRSLLLQIITLNLTSTQTLISFSSLQVKWSKTQAQVTLSIRVSLQILRFMVVHWTSTEKKAHIKALTSMQSNSGARMNWRIKWVSTKSKVNRTLVSSTSLIISRMITPSRSRVWSCSTSLLHIHQKFYRPREESSEFSRL